MIRTHTSTLGFRGYKKKSKMKVTQCHANFIQQYLLLK